VSARAERRERAQATRQRMVAAAYSLFCARGYSVPLTDIAVEAGVAVQTLYFTFHTKIALLSAALEMAVLGEGETRAPHEREWFDSLAAEPNPRKALKHMVDGTAAIYPRVAPLRDTLRSGDEEVRALWEHSEKLRVDGYRKVIDELARKGPFRPGIDAEAALDVLLALLSPDLYLFMAKDRGWSAERWRAWITTTLEEALYGPARSAR
jgi:AcrR family transcriptional regulator